MLSILTRGVAYPPLALSASTRYCSSGGVVVAPTVCILLEIALSPLWHATYGSALFCAGSILFRIRPWHACVRNRLALNSIDSKATKMSHL